LPREPVALWIEASACTGCGDCVAACAEQLRRRPAGQGDRALSRIRLLGSGPAFGLAVCRQCAPAPCADACIAGALRLDPLRGEVMLDDAACVGCAMCVMACPFGAIWLSLERRRSAKCDRCPASDLPPCVAACRPGALRLRPLPQLAAHHRRAATLARVAPAQAGWQGSDGAREEAAA
jgi:Fe-S-cluster-containing hydrogenase component 2